MPSCAFGNSRYIRAFGQWENIARRVVPGDVLIIPQGTELGIQLSAPAEMGLLTFDHGTLQAGARDDSMNGDLRLKFQFSLRDAQILSLFHALQEELKSGCVTGESYVRQLEAALIRYVASRAML